jgi:hypothetical protein
MTQFLKVYAAQLAPATEGLTWSVQRGWPSSRNARPNLACGCSVDPGQDGINRIVIHHLITMDGPFADFVEALRVGHGVWNVAVTTDDPRTTEVLRREGISASSGRGQVDEAGVHWVIPAGVAKADLLAHADLIYAAAGLALAGQDGVTFV